MKMGSNNMGSGLVFILIVGIASAQAQPVGQPKNGLPLTRVMSGSASVGRGWTGELELEPYLTDLGRGEATISWRTRSEVPSQFRYGRTPDYEMGSLSLSAGHQQSVLLTGLLTDSFYYYDVNSVFRGQFRTLPASDWLSFVAVGHTHGSEHFEHYPDPLLLDKLAGLDPHFVVHTGDSTYLSRTKDFDRYFFDLFQDVLPSTPVYIAPGNHDAGWPFYADLDLRPFKDLFRHPYPLYIQNDEKEAFYSYVKGDIRFLFLSYTSDLRPGSLQRAWITDELTSSNQRMNAVVFGGANAYYDESSFLDFLSQFPVDFIIRGDGRQPANPLGRHREIPMYYLGTGSSEPHRLLHFQYLLGGLTVTMYSPAEEMQFVDQISPAQGPQSSLGQETSVARVTRRGPHFAIPPYLTHLGPTGAVLNWRFDSSKSATFKFGTTHHHEILQLTTVSKEQQSIELSSLDPDTVYHYTVDGVPGRFKTSRRDPELSFVALGTEEFDIHPDGDLAHAISRLKPGFLIQSNSGLWNGGLVEYQDRFFRTYGDTLASTPIYVAPGNQVDLSIFRKLFPYDYAKASGEAHYSLVLADTRFLFASLASSLEPTGSLRAWIAQELARSSEAFRVVVFGGTQAVRSDEFFKFLAGAGVDFVIRGDVPQPNDPKQIIDEMPMYFVGTGDPTPHRLLYFERRARHWTVKLVAPTGDVRLVDWIHAGQRLPEALRLDPKQAQWSSSPGVFRAIFFPAPSLSTAEVAGLQMRLDLPPGLESVVVEAFVVPVESSGTSGIRVGSFPGFRSQWTRVNHEDGLVTIPLERTVSDTGAYFHIKRLMLRFLTSYPLTSHVLSEIHLYSPPTFPYGVGLAGSGGIAPIIGTSGEVPRVGSSTFKLEIADALGRSLAIIAVSTVRAEIPMFGGTLYGDFVNSRISLAWSLMTDGMANTPGTGTATLPIPIPHDPALVGLQTFWQGFVMDAGSPLPIGFTHTGGLAVTIH